MTRKSKIHEIRDYVIIALAMLIGSIGLNISSCLIISRWVVSAVSLPSFVGVLASLYPVSYFGLNVFLLLIAFAYLGWQFCVKTLYGISLFAISTRLH